MSTGTLESTLTGTQEREAWAGLYLTFELAGEVYGLEILSVQEIIGVIDVTHVPRTPAFVRGVINLRGKVIPVIDLRLKFGMEPQENTEKTCIIVVQVGPVIMGVLVDEVSEVLNIAEAQIDAAPSFGTGVDTRFIMSMAKVNDKVVMLLDICRVLEENELSAMKEIATQIEAE